MSEKNPKLSRRRFLAASLAASAAAATGIETERAASASGAQPKVAQPLGTAASGIKTSPAPSLGVTLPIAKARAFDFADVTLLPGPFLEARDRDAKYLLDLEPDRLLHFFLKNAGLTPKAEPYGGWEKAGVAGHVGGHYLSAISTHYRATGDARFKARIDGMVADLALCQEKNGDGYVSAIPDGRAMFNDVKAGKGDGVHRGWVPWYTMHKLFAGLRDAHLLGGNDQAKVVLVKLGDWAIETTKNLSEEQWQLMLTQEHGGMNEVLADVSAITGEAKYLELARKFRHKAVLDPLASRKDVLDGLHANTQIPKLVGLARIYELSGDEKERTAAEFFWQRVVDTRTFAMGGHSENEHFGPPNELSHHLGVTSAETCNTYNMLKLTRHLFEWEPRAELGDFSERALWNHILASQDPDKGMMTYYVSLKPGHFKTFSTPFDSMWCCVGTGIENHVRTGENLYFHNDDTLYVNQFIASTVKWKEKGATIRQDTRFPENGVTRLTVSCDRPTSFAFKVRHPAWAYGELTMKVNGRLVPSASANRYSTVKRQWKNGDVLEVTLPIGLHTESTPDDVHKIAILYGPIVLAGQLGRPDVPSQWAGDAGAYFNVADAPVPVLVQDNEPVNNWIKPLAGTPLTFRTHDVGLLADGTASDVTLRPFHDTHFEHYTVYWDRFTKAEWQQKQEEYRAEQDRQRELEARTVDEFRPGEQQAEVDHAFKGEKTNSGSYTDRKWRDARDGGFFEFTMKVAPDVAQELLVTYWGGETGNRVFDILVDGTVVGTQTLSNNKPGQFFDASYPLPADLLKNKTKVTIRFATKYVDGQSS